MAPTTASASEPGTGADAKFKTIAIPYYAILDADENVIATFPGATRDAGAYLAFLQKRAGLRKLRPAAPAARAIWRRCWRTTLDGAPVDTAALQGKVVVVDFWATYCVPCLKEIPTFNQLHEAARESRRGGAGCVDGYGWRRAAGGIVSEGASDEVPGGAGIRERLTDVFHVNQLPTTVVFDRQGKTLQRFEGYTPADALENVVKTAL